MGLEKFLKTVLVGALMMCPFVMLGENTNEGSMVPSDSIAVADSGQPTVSLDADTVFADDAVAVEFVDESTRFNAKQLRMEYKDASVWYGVGAYVVATGVGVLRVWNERHWATDVLAGAGIGILSARVAYWLLPFERRLFGLDKKKNASDMVAVPYYSPTDRSFGASLALTF